MYSQRFYFAGEQQICAFTHVRITVGAGTVLLLNVTRYVESNAYTRATATMSTINGTSYDVCTTTQYNNYKPSCNSTSITVTPQTTIGATTLINHE